VTVSVIVVTLNRPECVQQCLDCLRLQEPQPTQIVIIDASADDATAVVTRAFAEVEYIRTDVGYGHMTKSRNLGLWRATGDVVVFIDDDAFAHDGWLAALIEPYANAQVGGVGGRALNNVPGEEARGIDRIGRLLANGTLTGNFAADPGRVIEVDHLIGCNMSWRRTVLIELGGLRDDYPGTEVREETDIALRVRKLGYQLVFQPRAVVTHAGAPQARGRRFDTRYAFYASRNHAQLLVRNFGLTSGIVWRSGLRDAGTAIFEAVGRYAAATARLGARLSGLAIGMAVGCVLRVKERGNVRRLAMVRPISSGAAAAAAPEAAKA
jgi:GT2 family glycosyltransferase